MHIILHSLVHVHVSIVYMYILCKINVYVLEHFRYTCTIHGVFCHSLYED